MQTVLPAIEASDTVVSRLDAATQNRIISDMREIIRHAPLVRPIAKGGHPMKVRISAAGKLGWTADGNGYKYVSSQSNGEPWPNIPKLWLDIADSVAGRHRWDSVIINWYDPSASLGLHQDVDEADTSLPIVTIGIGDAATWSVGPSRNKVSKTKIVSGDVTLLAGPTRDYFHSVTNIVADLFSPLKARGRVSATIRVAGI